MTTLFLAWALIISCHRESSNEGVRQASNNGAVDATKLSAAMLNGDVIDITELERNRHPAARDLVAMIRAETEELGRCADPVRHIVRERKEIGFGKVGVIVDVVAKRGGNLRLTTLDVERVFESQSGFASCVRSVIRGEVPVLASADYALHVRVHLCVQPERPKVATREGKP
ncbi:MAG TPA: hypothetical protein VHW23_00320 [Kofleriaceae bacterium]|nr:hypothetical protein [Kofleriaceae bacterium]